MKTIKIWLDNPLNDATAFYVGLIEQALQKAGLQCERVITQAQLSGAPYVVTLHAKATCAVLLRNPGAKVITWFQGIVPEEAMLWRGKRLPNRVYKLGWELFERFALKLSWMSLFVSDAMRKHYLAKYSTAPRRLEIVPCFNQRLDEKSFFFPGKYAEPTFVYAGGMDGWQCVEEMLALYSKVEKLQPAARLAILTAQKNVAEELVAKYAIRNATISYVPLSALAAELQKYKYGFLLRRDDPINNVATPTKMNTYLASGLIPIYTTAIRDFERFLDLELALKVADVDDTDEMIVKWEQLQRVPVDPHAMLAAYRRIFSSYYCPERYVDAMAAQFAGLLRSPGQK